MSSVWVVIEDGGYDNDAIYRIFDNENAANECVAALFDADDSTYKRDDRYYVEEHELASTAPKRVDRWIGRVRRGQRGWRCAEPEIHSDRVWDYQNGELSTGGSDRLAWVAGPDRNVVEACLADVLADLIAAENKLVERARARRKAETVLRGNR